ncbi:MAG: GDP-mannose 4,6-dehydratase, partial [Longimicrobiales bacterium]
AGDYVEAMWLMLQQDAPDDYVVATGESHSVRELVEAAFELVGLDWREYVRIDPRYRRPTEVHHLSGDASHARTTLGWKPTVTFAELVRMMVASDRELARQERTLTDAGHVVPIRGLAAR